MASALPGGASPAGCRGRRGRESKPRPGGHGREPMSWDDEGSDTTMDCPYCGEPGSLEIEPEEEPGEQVYVEDCGVCCRPWSVRVRTDDPERDWLLSIDDAATLTPWTDSSVAQGLLELPAEARAAPDRGGQRPATQREIPRSAFARSFLRARE